jgi:phosphate transport system permease protein
VSAAQDIATPRNALSGDVNLGDRIFRWVGLGVATIILLVLAAIVLELTSASTPSLSKFGLGFLWSSDWDAVRGSYGALPFLFGTVVSSLLALLITVPVAFGVAIYLAELAPAWVRTPIGFMVELLAAIPSVVYGLWGIFVLKPFMVDVVAPVLRTLFGWIPVIGGLFSGPFDGLSMLTGAFILSIMILPTVASISRDVLRAVPAMYREGALALGATRWEAVRHAVLPMVRSGLVGAVLLGLGRALGETMAVTMVIGNDPHIHASLFGKSQTMASELAMNYNDADKLGTASLTEIALILFVVTLLFNIGARLLVWRFGRGPNGGRTP